MLLPPRSDVEEICRRLDGVPLAIELAAARTERSHPPIWWIDWATAAPPDRRPPNQRRNVTGPLRATIQWSYDLLAPAQQTLFQRLSVFAGPFDLEGGWQPWPPAKTSTACDIDDLLEDLVEKSMLTVESGPFGRLFRLLETMREFAAEQLARSTAPPT